MFSSAVKIRLAKSMPEDSESSVCEIHIQKKFAFMKDIKSKEMRNKTDFKSTY